MTFLSKSFLFHLCACFLLSLTTFAQADSQKGITNLGPQVYATAIQGSAFTTNSKGEEFVFTVVRGMPAQFIGFNLSTREKIVEAPLPYVDGAWDMVVSSLGYIYVAGANGQLFEHTLGEKTIKNLGKPISSEKVLWDLSADEKGFVYGGTYPNARIFSYHPQHGFNAITSNAVVSGELYVRSNEYHIPTQKFFIGVGSHAHLVEYDFKTKKLKEFLPVEHKKEEFIYDMSIATGLKSGDRLFAFLNGANRDDWKTLIYNIKTEKFEKELPVLDIKSVIKAPKGQLVYFASKGTLYTIDFSKKNPTPKSVTQISGKALSTAWDPSGKLSIITNKGIVFKYDPKDNSIITIPLELPRQPIEIQSIHYGPDQKIWVAGYLAGGHAAYDPKTGKSITYDGLHQTEGMATLDNEIFMGIYTNAELYRFDPSKDWNLKSTNPNPRHLGRVPTQDRPFAILPIKEKNKVLFGTIPAYGKLGGSITYYDLKTDQLQFYHQVIPNQSITSLTQLNNRVWGSTSIFGGLGGVPTENEAVIFEWDVDNAKVIRQIKPVSNALAITGLTPGPDGHLWGFADGTLFIYDINLNKVIRTKEFYQLTSRPSHIWRNAFIKVHPNGNVYVAAQKKIYKVDPASLDFETIADGYELLTMDDEGTLYFKNSINLFQYKPEH